MFTDDIGDYRKNSGRVRLTSDIGAYRKPPYGLTRCTDDIAPFRGESISMHLWVLIFALVVVGVAVSLLVILALA